MKSGKQRRVEIMARRKKLVVKRKAMAKAVAFRHAPYRFVPVNEELLAPNKVTAPLISSEGATT